MPENCSPARVSMQRAFKNSSVLHGNSSDGVCELEVFTQACVALPLQWKIKTKTKRQTLSGREPGSGSKVVDL